MATKYQDPAPPLASAAARKIRSIIDHNVLEPDAEALLRCAIACQEGATLEEVVAEIKGGAAPPPRPRLPPNTYITEASGKVRPRPGGYDESKWDDNHDRHNP